MFKVLFNKKKNADSELSNIFLLDVPIVELAAMVQKADEFTRATAGSKLSIIAEQVSISLHPFLTGSGSSFKEKVGF